MTDLTNALFQFLNTRQYSGLLQDPEHQKAKGYAEAKRELLSSCLDKRQRQLLDDLMEKLKLVHFFEQEYIFQATLSLGRELSGLVRP